MDVKRRAVLLGIVAIAGIVVVPEVLARRRAGSGMRGLPNGARHKGPVLTRDQLRQCVAEQNTINTLESEMDRLRASLTQSEASINRLEAQISEQQPLIDRYSQESVNSFNALIDQHKRLVDTHNAKIPVTNISVEKVNSAVERFNAKCADRVYYENDMQAVLAGK